MGDFNLADTSLPDRVNATEKEIHTLLFRMDQFEKQRLPDRLTETEAAVENLQHNLLEMRAAQERTNQLVNTVRQEVNADIEQLEGVVQERVGHLQSSIDRMTGRVGGMVTVVVVIGTAMSFLMDHWDRIKVIFGG